MNSLTGLKKPLYAPMLSSFGGGSSRGFNPGGGGGDGDLGAIYGATNQLTFSWSDDWTHGGQVTDWNMFPNSAGLFCSGFILYSATDFSAPVSANANTFTSTNSVSSVTAPNGASGSYTVSQITNTNNQQGAWLENDDSRTLLFTFSSNLNASGTPSKSVVYTGYSSGNHQPAIFKLTGNGVTRIFAFPHVGTPSGPTYQYFPLKADFTSFNDSRLTGASGATLNSSYFEWSTV